VPAEPEPRAFVAAGGEAGRRLDVVLAACADLSRALAGRLIDAGGVRVDGRPARKGHVLRAGETVTWTPPADAPAALEAEDVPLRVVYEDDWLLVVDKPAGVVVHPAPGHEHGTLVHGLMSRGIRGGHGRRPGIVHRLDKETSGLLIVARRDDAYRRLVATMARREVSRVYLALLAGELPQDEGTVDAPIGRHVRDRKRMSVHTARPRPAVTHFRVLARAAGHTLAEIRLETGRTHQIRVHMAALGYPVAGDTTYSRTPRPAGLGRHFLHAVRLTFPHPEDGRVVSFEAPLPDELARYLAEIGIEAPAGRSTPSPGGE
jgi:23S rRNA pseudouridine1911/1915/1917 synthase